MPPRPAVQADVLEATFQPYGTLQKVKLIKDKGGGCPCFGRLLLADGAGRLSRRMPAGPCAAARLHATNCVGGAQAQSDLH